MANTKSGHSSDDIFHGAGWRRQEHCAAAEQAGRKADARMAERIARLGRNPYIGEDEDFLVRLDTGGGDIEARGRRLRRLPIFKTTHAADHAERMASYKVFLSEIGHDGQCKHIVGRPKASFPGVLVASYREHHVALRRSVRRAIEHAGRHYGIDVDWCAIHAPPREQGAYIDIHFHLVARGDAAAIGRWFTYLAKRFDTVWANGADSERDAVSVLEYADRDQPVRGTDDFSDANLLIFLEQIEGQEGRGSLHWFESYGSFRRHRGDHKRAGEELVEERHAGRVRWRYRKRHPRPKRNPSSPRSGERLVRVTTAWMGGVRVPVMVVKNYRGNFAAIVQAYQLERLIEHARNVMRRHV